MHKLGLGGAKVGGLHSQLGSTLQTHYIPPKLPRTPLPFLVIVRSRTICVICLQYLFYATSIFFLLSVCPQPCPSPFHFLSLQVLMKDIATPIPAEEVKKVVRKCLEKAALINYTRLTEYAKIEGQCSEQLSKWQ